MKSWILFFALVVPLAANVVPTRENPWAASGSVALGASYDYNPLLSAVAPAEGEALKASMEAMVWRQLGKETEISTVISGEKEHYLGKLDFLDDSQFWMAEAQVKTWTARRLVLKGRVRALWNEQVMDFSDTEVVRVVLPVRVATVSVGGGATWKLKKGLALEAEGEATKAYFRGYRGDYREGKGRLRLVQKSERFEGEVGVEYGRRPYRFRTNYSLSGRPLAGDLLTSERTRLFGSFSYQPAWAYGVKVKVGGAYRKVEDGATGFFTTGTDTEWITLGRDGQTWTWDVRVSRDRERYANQTVGTGIHPALRSSNDREVSGRMERVLSAQWSLVTEASIQKMDANAAEYAYKTVTVSGALERHF